MKYLIFIFSLAVAQTSYGCSFGPDADLFKTADENIGNPKYSYVLSGTITDLKENEEFGREYTFDIESVHKGVVETKQVTLSSPGHSCGFFSEVGIHMLVFLQDLVSIDESNPRYIFDSVAEAASAGKTITHVVIEKPHSCTKEYAPVCARVEVQCIQAPCPPIDNTYANACLAEADNAKFLYTGPCVLPQAPSKKPLQGEPEAEPSRVENLPTSDPTVGFVEPKTPPPFDNSVKPEAPVEKKWWQSVWAWITRMLSF